MYVVLTEFCMGWICGLFLGTTGIAPTGLMLLLLDWMNIGTYLSNLGTILFLNLFPLTLGSVVEFYKTGHINFELSVVLLFAITLGSYMGSRLAVGKFKLKEKQLKYITAAVGFAIFVTFLYAAMQMP